MAWIESHTVLEGHPKLSPLQDELRWSKNEAVGFIHRFWWKVLEYTPNGVVSKYSTSAWAAMLDMKPALFERAHSVMLRSDVGLLFKRGKLTLVKDWPQYAGRYLRDSLFKRHPEKWSEVMTLYEMSADCLPTVGGLSAVPDRTNHIPPKAPQGGRERNGRSGENPKKAAIDEVINRGS